MLISSLWIECDHPTPAPSTTLYQGSQKSDGNSKWLEDQCRAYLEMSLKKENILLEWVGGEEGEKEEIN